MYGCVPPCGQTCSTNELTVMTSHGHRHASHKDAPGRRVGDAEPGLALDPVGAGGDSAFKGCVGVGAKLDPFVADAFELLLLLQFGRLPGCAGGFPFPVFLLREIRDQFVARHPSHRHPVNAFVALYTTHCGSAFVRAPTSLPPHQFRVTQLLLFAGGWRGPRRLGVRSRRPR